MEPTVLAVFAEIIKAAAVSGLGVVALCCLLFAFLAWKFFKDANQYVRLFVFVLLFTGFVGLFVFSTYQVTPFVANPALGEARASSTQEKESDASQDPIEATRTEDTRETEIARRQEKVAEVKRSVEVSRSRIEDKAIVKKLPELSRLGKPKVTAGVTRSKQEHEPMAQLITKKVDCGQHETPWLNVGAKAGSPCPSGCYPGAELGQSYRIVGFPPRAQVKHKFQCWKDERVSGAERK